MPTLAEIAKTLKAPPVTASLGEILSDALDFGEITTGTKARNVTMIEWNTKTVDAMFGTNWETSQVNAILNHLDLLDDKDAFVAGGALVRNYLKLDIFKGDFDIFPTSKAGKENIIAKLTAKLGAPTQTKHTQQFEYKLGARKIKVQVIEASYADPESRMGQFDFDHCRIAFYRGKLISSDSAFTNLALRNINVEYIRDPAYSMYRLTKYMDLGFHVTTDAIKKLTYMISRGLKDTHVADVTSGTEVADFENEKKEASY